MLCTADVMSDEHSDEEYFVHPPKYRSKAVKELILEVDRRRLGEIELARRTPGAYSERDIRSKVDQELLSDSGEEHSGEENTGEEAQ